tara:strand:+ start:9170 stop:9478 length:309 start_codon:yes stop_codon:yes gene_type:complete
MRKKNWIEFSNKNYLNQQNTENLSSDFKKEIKISIEKKGRNGKVVTVISGINYKNKLETKVLLKSLKVFCSTGGKLNNQDINLQGDMVEKVKDYLRKLNYLD